MLTRTITYTDYNGVERTEIFRFNLTRSEIVEMQLETEGGLDKFLQKIIDAKEQTKLISLFKRLVLKAYGEVSDDGRRFMKSKEISDAFSQTEAYNQIFMELATDTDAATKFVNGILPKNMNNPGADVADVTTKVIADITPVSNN